MSILQRSNLRRIRRVGKSEIFMYRATQKTGGQPTRAGLLSRDDRQGGDDIFRILDNNGLTFGDMFGRCERRYGAGNYHFTRLDVAIDDRNETPFFTIEQIKKKCEKRNLSPTVRATILTRASLMILTPQRPSISGWKIGAFLPLL